MASISSSSRAAELCHQHDALDAGRDARSAAARAQMQIVLTMAEPQTPPDVQQGVPGSRGGGHLAASHAPHTLFAQL